MARRPKYTAELGIDVCKLVRLGVPVATAAQSVGISKTTLYNWRCAGENGREPYRRFIEQLDAAMAEAEVAITLNVIRQSRDDWRAGAWWLERRHPDLEEKLQAGLQALIEELRPRMTEGAYAELLRALAQVMGFAEVAGPPTKSLSAGTDTKH